MWIATFPLHAASLFSGDAVHWIRVIYMLSVKLSCDWIVFHGCDWCIFGSGSATVRCHTALLMIGFLIVGIQASDISNSLFLLIFLGRSLTWIASFTLRVLKWGSRSIYFTPLQSGQCPVLIIIIISSSARAFFFLLAVKSQALSNKSKVCSERQTPSSLSPSRLKSFRG